jgi:hypothetical protein
VLHPPSTPAFGGRKQAGKKSCGPKNFQGPHQHDNDRLKANAPVRKNPFTLHEMIPKTGAWTWFTREYSKEDATPEKGWISN